MGIIGWLAFFGIVSDISNFFDKRKQKKEIKKLEREQRDKIRELHNYVFYHYSKDSQSNIWIRNSWYPESDGPKYLDEDLLPIYFQNNHIEEEEEEEEEEESSASIRRRFKNYCNNNEIEFELDPEYYTIPSDNEMLRIMDEDRNW